MFLGSFESRLHCFPRESRTHASIDGKNLPLIAFGLNASQYFFPERQMPLGWEAKLILKSCTNQFADWGTRSRRAVARAFPSANSSSSVRLFLLFSLFVGFQWAIFHSAVIFKAKINLINCKWVCFDFGLPSASESLLPTQRRPLLDGTAGNYLLTSKYFLLMC